jgi:hypothetical protein
MYMIIWLIINVYNKVLIIYRIIVKHIKYHGLVLQSLQLVCYLLFKKLIIIDKLIKN